MLGSNTLHCPMTNVFEEENYKSLKKNETNITFFVAFCIKKADTKKVKSY